jgi:gluconate 2-dehydrogenase gamma chain
MCTIVPETASIGDFRMGGQQIERREVLRFIGLASVAGSFTGFHRWAFACSPDPSDASPAQAVTRPYEPLFFSPEQFRIIEQLVEMIIPANDTPGAKEAGVAEFIDFMVEKRVSVSPGDSYQSVRDGRGKSSAQDRLRMGDEIQEQFVLGLAWLNARSKSEVGHEFMDCSAAQQNGLLEELAYRAKYKPNTEIGREFFQLVRDYTVVGYYTTKIGLQSLGYPGLREVWPSMPGCTHPHDPEHAHLQESGALNLAALKTANHAT